MRIDILIFEGLTALDAVGPYEVLSRIPDVEIRFVAPKPGWQRSSGGGGLSLLATHGLDTSPPPDIMLIPGGAGVLPLMEDEAVLKWIRTTHAASRWTLSVCTGSLLLGAAGVLRGVRATTHWMAMDQLKAFGAIPVKERVAVDGRIVTGAGVSAGIDMALRMVHLLAGETMAKGIQLRIEYDPQPPYDAGAPERAAPEIIELARTLSKP